MMAIADEIELLRPAVERLRVVLRRMDTADVPAKLRQLTRSSARRVPPPLLQGAVDALDEDEWLRSQVVDTGDALDIDASQRPEAASALFLLRPETWEEEFAKLVEASEETSLASKVARLDQRRQHDALSIKRLRAEVKELKRERDFVMARTAERYQENIAERSERLAKTEARRVEAERHGVEMEERILKLEEELRDIRSRLEGTRQALERERRKPSGPVESDGAGMPGTPEAVASTLDRVMLSVRRDTVTEKWDVPDEELGTPPALPDTPDAVAELLSDRRVWLIDGYNVSYLLAGGRPESMDRLRLESRLGRLLGKAARGTTVTVYWDSSEGVDSRSGGPGVAVRFVPSADEAIIEHAGPATVVVSTDRRVREESEEKGAVTLWSQALIGWFGN